MSPPLHPDRVLRRQLAALAVFLLAAVAAAAIIWRAEQHDRQEERTRVANLADDHAVMLQGNIERALSATYALSALVLQGNGNVANFDAVGHQMLQFYPGVMELALGPGGVIQSVVPLAGNEKALGFDLLRDPRQKQEALLARNSGKLTLAGPLELVQGGTGVVGRLPVFLEGADGEPTFWGFTLVAMRIADALSAGQLPQVERQGYAYELWRLHPDSGAKQVIAASTSAALIDPVARSLQVPNSTWTLNVAPVKGWGNPFGLLLNAGIGLLVSLLLAYATRLLLDLRAQQRELEHQVAQRTAEVRAREADLNRAQSVAQVGSWMLDYCTRKMHGSAEAMRLFGMNDGGAFEFKSVLERVHPDDRGALAKAWHAARDDGRYDLEFRIVIGDSIRWVHSFAELSVDADGIRRRALGTVQDITLRKQAEQALRDGAEKLRLFADNVPALTASLDENLRYRFANKHYADFFGVRANDVPGRHLREVIGEAAYHEVRGNFAKVLQGHPVTYQRTHTLPDGTPRHMEIKLLPDAGEQGRIQGCFAVTTDITERKLAEEHIHRVAHHDSLTGLPNRLLFNDRLHQAISLAKRDARQFALLYLDLDKFKPVNDSLGHSAGDELLQGVAARLRREVRESDTVARIGGDEFSVILPDIAAREEAEIVARKIIAALVAPFQLGAQGQSVHIGASIGIALYPADGRDADALVRAADGAMYSAKQVGSCARCCPPQTAPPLQAVR